MIEEDEWQTAEALLLQESLAAPDFLIVECGNVLWAKAKRGIPSRDLACAGLAAIQAAL